MNEARAALILCQVEGMTPARLRTLYTITGSFAALLEMPAGQAPEKLTPLIVEYQRQATQYQVQGAECYERYHAASIAVVPLSDPTYPTLLKEIAGPPPILFVKGDPALLSLPQLAIVGSRKASKSGLEHARSFARDLAKNGFVVTSGLALGIDGAAHEGALTTGKTLAVLGCGVDILYPRQHQRLYDHILASGGAIVSELMPGTGVRSSHFPRRNRIISGLSMGVLVVEAAPRSGSLITARLAMEQGREVFAIPGSVHNPQARGCHQLIREGAVLTETLEDIVNQLGGMLAYKADELDAMVESPAVSPVEQVILDAMGFDPLELDSLVELTGLSASELIGALVTLELEGLVENNAGVYNRLRR